MTILANYSGDVSAKQSYEILSQESSSFLIDVRTIPEWNFSGIPDLLEIDKKLIKISWMFYPQMNFNQDFLKQLEKEIPDKNSKIFFICKVGGRSIDAATLASSAGYRNCFNVKNGFEGDHNEFGQRGKVNGWKAEGLPWHQS